MSKLNHIESITRNIVSNECRYMANYDGSENNPLHLFGIECGQGWIPIISDLLNSLLKMDFYKNIRIYQIKEKYGQFRFYYNSLSLSNTERCKFQNRIDVCKTKLSKTCEQCGGVGHLVNDGASKIRITCNNCK